MSNEQGAQALSEYPVCIIFGEKERDLEHLN